MLNIQQRKRLLSNIIDNYTSFYVKKVDDGEELRLIHKDGTEDGIRFGDKH